MDEFIEACKHRIKLILKRLGYRLTRLDVVTLFDPLLFYLHRNTRDFFFIQIGANDGRRYDPIFDFVTRNHDNLKGLVIEPLEDVFHELQRNYKNYPNITPVNVAIHNSEKEMVLYTVDPLKSEHLGEWSKAIASFLTDHHKRFDVPSEYIVHQTVKCISFCDLIQRHQVKKIDLLQIDTEGYDAEIIRSIDFNAITPTVIHFEHGLPYGTMNKEDLSGLVHELHDNGYEVFIGACDAIAYQRFLFLDIQTS